MVTIERIFHLCCEKRMRRERTREKRNKKITKTAEQEISGILRKIYLEGLVESFYEKDITPDVVCKLTKRISRNSD